MLRGDLERCLVVAPVSLGDSHLVARVDTVTGRVLLRHTSG